jgi:hypothetical protein
LSAREDRTEVAKFLVHAKSDVAARDRCGEHARRLCVRYCADTPRHDDDDGDGDGDDGDGIDDDDDDDGDCVDDAAAADDDDDGNVKGYSFKFQMLSINMSTNILISKMITFAITRMPALFCSRLPLQEGTHPPALVCLFWSYRNCKIPRPRQIGRRREGQVRRMCPPCARALLCCQPHMLRCRDGRTPLKLAIDANHTDVAAFLRSVGTPE